MGAYRNWVGQVDVGGPRGASGIEGCTPSSALTPIDTQAKAENYGWFTSGNEKHQNRTDKQEN